MVSALLFFGISFTPSPISAFEAAWDGVTISASTTIDSFYQKLGARSFFATSTDYVGNTATSSVNFRITATIRSLVNDINRSYRLGWIDGKGVVNSLLKKLAKFLGENDERGDERDGKDKNKDKELDEALKALGKELSAQRGKHVSEQAYQLLSEDIKWLLAN